MPVTTANPTTIDGARWVLGLRVIFIAIAAELVLHTAGMWGWTRDWPVGIASTLRLPARAAILVGFALLRVPDGASALRAGVMSGRGVAALVLVAALFPWAHGLGVAIPIPERAWRPLDLALLAATALRNALFIATLALLAARLGERSLRARLWAALGAYCVAWAGVPVRLVLTDPIEPLHWIVLGAVGLAYVGGKSVAGILASEATFNSLPRALLPDAADSPDCPD